MTTSPVCRSICDIVPNETASISLVVISRIEADGPYLGEHERITVVDRRDVLLARGVNDDFIYTVEGRNIHAANTCDAGHRGRSTCFRPRLQSGSYRAFFGTSLDT